MEYKVEPFKVKVGNDGNERQVANQVATFISQETSYGWEFVNCGNIDTQIEVPGGSSLSAKQTNKQPTNFRG